MINILLLTLVKRASPCVIEKILFQPKCFIRDTKAGIFSALEGMSLKNLLYLLLSLRAGLPEKYAIWIQKNDGIQYATSSAKILTLIILSHASLESAFFKENLMYLIHFNNQIHITSTMQGSMYI